MTAAEKHIRHYNNLNGKVITKATLTRFHDALKNDIDSKRIDAHVAYGVECIAVEKRIAKALKEMNGSPCRVKCKAIRLGKPKNIIVTQTARGPEIVKAKKAVHYHHEDLTLLYGLPCIEDDRKLKGQPLDGVNSDVYKVITDRIIQLLEAGGLLWRKPWNADVNSSKDLAHNGVTKFAYRGVNYILNFLSEAMGGLTIRGKDGKEITVSYKHMDFYTFNQVKELKGSVKKGEMGWPVTYFKWLYKNLKTDKLVSKEEAMQGGMLKPGYDRIPGLFYYTVFNYEQCQGFKSSFERSKPKTESEKIESAENIVMKYSAMPGAPGFHIVAGSEGAFYSPSKDSITMPSIKQFKKAQEYYSVFFHEMIHSTGAQSRLDRDLTGKFGSKSYAFEELIAEMGACYLCGESGIFYYTMKNSAAYVANWSKALLKEMKEDPKFFLKACSAAQRASDFVLGRSYEAQEEKEAASQPKPKEKERKSFVPKSRGSKSREKISPTTVRQKKGEEKIKAMQPVLAGSGTQEIKKATTSSLGFITADKTPEKSADTFTVPGPIGDLLGNMQRYKLEIVIAGETHSGKSELGKQIADAFIAGGHDVAYVDWEQGGMQSRDTKESIDRNVRAEHRAKLHVSSEVPRTLQAIKSLAGKFPVIMIDSGSKLNQVTNAWIDELREQYPDTIWIILMQQNEKGGTRGGAAAEFDSPIVLKTYRPDESDYKLNYAYVYKNRGNPQTTGKYYLIADKRIVKEEPIKKTNA